RNKEELYVCGGRISIGELSKILCVDFSHVSTQASLLVSSDPSVFMILGQLIDDTYLDTLSEEVNEVLQQKGTISISALTKDYDLPSEFMEEQFHKRIGSIIEGFTDSGNPKIIMTQSYVKR
ncbi:UFM1specific ligase 1, partial [Caligus rogercresseyi]